MGRTIGTDPLVVYDAQVGEEFRADTSLVVVQCATCGITYAIPASLRESALKWPGDRPNGWKLCCPLGHTWWHVGKTREEHLEDALRRERSLSGWLAAERDQAQAEARGQKAAKTRIRNQRDRERARVAAGVCPCCSRSFKDLGRHMAAEHPDYATGGGE